MRWLPLLLICVLACDDANDGPPLAEDCANADLVAQCPPGSNPLLGVQAQSACSGAASGVVSDQTGQATGQCYGAGSCRVVCQFAVPCRCGVASVTRDGVVCADCEDAASCGNTVCESGESPENCPIDCGSVCEPDERRCAGEVLEVCNLQGRWDTLGCPRDAVCNAEDGRARCLRDIDIIGGDDAGVDDDAGPPPMDGRIIDGDGEWPAVVSAVRGETPRQFVEETVVFRLDDGSIHARPTPYAQASAAVVVDHFRLVPGERLLQGFGRTGHFIMDFDGTVTEAPGRPFDEAAFCDAAAACNNDTADCAAFVAAQRIDHGDRLACVAESVIGGNCIDLFLGCAPQYALPYPGDAQLGGAFVRVGDRLLGVDGVNATVVDLATNAHWTMDPVGEFRLDGRPGLLALSADGRVAALMAVSGNDEAVIIWDIEANVRRPILPESGAGGSRLALSPDGQVLALARVPAGGTGSDEVLHLYDLNTDTRLYSIRPPPDATLFGRSLAGMRFSPDGRTMAVAVVPAQTVELWDLVARARTHILEFDAEIPIKSMAFSPDGALLAVTRHLGMDAPLNLWDVASGQRIATFTSAPPPVFDPDGSRVLIDGGSGPQRTDFVILSER